MPRKSRVDNELREFLIQEVENHSTDLASTAAKRFSVTRVTVNRYLQRLVEDQILSSQGNTRSRIYKLNDFLVLNSNWDLREYKEEDVIYRRSIQAYLLDLPQNIIDILQHGVNEMINNAIDHSESDFMVIRLERNAKRTSVVVSDSGVGIFRKIKRAHNLMDERHAILELSKGKLTTDPERHSGEGIFFTSRMFSRFSISSGGLYYRRQMKSLNDEWLIEADKIDEIELGTTVKMEINNECTHTCKDIFSRHEDDELGFAKTHVPVRLARYDVEQLVSRSQARRVLARFNRFSEVMLDFSDVTSIGQAFADEIFRVYAKEHPEVAIIPVCISKDVEAMIRHVTNNRLIARDAIAPGSEPL